MSEELKQTREQATAVLKACEGYENIDLSEEESGFLSGTHPNGLPVRIAGSDETGWFEVHGGICSEWLLRGGPTGELGLPRSNEEPDPGYRDSYGKRSRFQHGTIHGWPTDPNQPKGAWTFEVEHFSESFNSVTPSVAMSERTRSRLEKFDRELDVVKAIRTQLDGEEFMSEVRRTFDDALSEIVRRRRAFDSKTFFMVTFGMLKAGKSTLVNTFVGKEVSPVGRSKETTLRSSVILAADGDSKQGIYLYSPKNGASGDSEEAVFEWRRKNCAAMMDFLDGMTTRDEFLSLFKEEVLPFSGQALERLLTEETIPEYPNILPPVIRIDPSRTDSSVGAANLLKDGVAIFDTPGLDGARANKDTDPFWRILPSNGDYFLLVQSSMSAINKDCLSLITDIYRATKDAPVLVVFNEIASNFWLLPDVEKSKLRDDSETASKELSNRLRTTLGGILPERVSINAGEASDAVFGGTDEFRKDVPAMIDESRIRDLRNRIVRTLREERGAIKERNATNRMAKALDDAVLQIESAGNAMREAERKTADAASMRRENARSASDALSNAFEGDGPGVCLARAFGETLKGILAQNPVPIPNNPYSEFKGFGRNRKDNCAYCHGQDADAELAKAASDVKDSFLNFVRKQFIGGCIPIGVLPWKNTMGQQAGCMDSLRKTRSALTEDGGFVSPTPVDNSFPDSLFRDFDIQSLLAFANSEDFRPKIPGIQRVEWRPWRDRAYGSDTVWEYECARQFDKLRDALKERFPVKAAEKVGAALRDAIVEKGKHYAHDIKERIEKAINSDKENSDNRNALAENYGGKVSDAVRHLENMKRILAED